MSDEKKSEIATFAASDLVEMERHEGLNCLTAMVIIIFLYK